MCICRVICSAILWWLGYRIRHVYVVNDELHTNNQLSPFVSKFQGGLEMPGIDWMSSFQDRKQETSSLVMVYCAFRQAPPSRATACTTSETNIKLAAVLAAVRLCLNIYSPYL